MADDLCSYRLTYRMTEIGSTYGKTC